MMKLSARDMRDHRAASTAVVKYVPGVVNVVVPIAELVVLCCSVVLIQEGG